MLIRGIALITFFAGNTDENIPVVSLELAVFVQYYPHFLSGTMQSDFDIINVNIENLRDLLVGKSVYIKEPQHRPQVVWQQLEMVSHAPGHFLLFQYAFLLKGTGYQG